MVAHQYDHMTTRVGQQNVPVGSKIDESCLEVDFLNKNTPKTCNKRPVGIFAVSCVQDLLYLAK